jgi:predicted MFS family arabinose efflux permease
MMFRVFKNYLGLEKAILNVIVAEFFLQLINSAFLSIQLIYMQKCGYSDHLSAGFISYRFLGVLLLAVPLGLYIKGRKIKSLFYISCTMLPLCAIAIILSTFYHADNLLVLSQFLWGVSFTFLQIPVLPYILRNTIVEKQTEAIALSYSTYSFAGIASGLIIFVLNSCDPLFFDERTILIIISLAGLSGIYFISRIKIEEKVPDISEKRTNLAAFDWRLIIRGLIPTLIIAIGAGLTIPFISIFFFNVHHMDTDSFSIVSAIAAILVAAGAMLVPEIKRTVGYKIAIPTTQSLAVLALILLATTQYYAQLNIAVYVAVFCFMLRQPLMNLAGPMTSELVMNYVGKRNQEIVSALISAIWSGSWFISSRIFKSLREDGVAYVNVFLITAFLYAIGVVWYYILILDFNKREKGGLL